MNSTELATRPGGGTMQISDGKTFGDLNLDEQWRFATTLCKSNMFPSLKTNEQAMTILLAGQTAGLTFMESVQFLYVVKGRLAWMGDGALAQIRRSGHCASLTFNLETLTDDKGEYRSCTLKTHRKGETSAVEFQYTQRDAARAQLWGKAGSWTSDPDSMLRWRCVSRAAKFVYSDCMMGMGILEVERDRDYPNKADRNEHADEGAEVDPILGQLSGETDDDVQEAEFTPVEEVKEVEEVSTPSTPKPDEDKKSKVLSEIKAAIHKHYPSQSTEDKQAKRNLTVEAFGCKLWSQVQKLAIDKLHEGMGALTAILSDEDSRKEITGVDK